MNAHVYGNYFGNSTGKQLVCIITILPMLVTVPIDTKLVPPPNGKKESIIIGLFGSGAIYFILYILKIKI